MTKDTKKKNKQAAQELLAYFKQGGRLYLNPDNPNELLTEEKKKKKSKRILK